MVWVGISCFGTARLQREPAPQRSVHDDRSLAGLPAQGVRLDGRSIFLPSLDPPDSLLTSTGIFIRGLWSVGKIKWNTAPPAARPPPVSLPGRAVAKNEL